MFRAVLILFAVTSVLSGTGPAFAESDASTANSDERTKIADERPQIAAEPDKSSHSSLSKLRKATFAEDHFSIMLPPGYEAKVQTGNEQRVAVYTVEDYPHGTYEITCNTAPQHSAFSPLLLKKTIETRKDIKKIESSQPIKIGDFTGTSWDVSLQTPSPHDSGKVIGVITGPRMYVLTASGTKPWLESAAVKQFLQSFELIPD